MPGSKVDDFALLLPDKAFTVLLRGSESYMPLEKVNLLLSERSYVNGYPVHNLNAHVESAAISDNVSGLCEVRSIWANVVSRKARVIGSSAISQSLIPRVAFASWISSCVKSPEQCSITIRSKLSPPFLSNSHPLERLSPRKTRCTKATMSVHCLQFASLFAAPWPNNLAVSFSQHSSRLLNRSHIVCASAYITVGISDNVKWTKYFVLYADSLHAFALRLSPAAAHLSCTIYVPYAASSASGA